MKDVEALHKRAMDIAEEAALQQAAGHEAAARDLYTQALEHERQAAQFFESQIEMEPTRSVLYRSAASLALDCHDNALAERLTATGLAGTPPAEIAGELRDLMEQANFQRHLDLRGVVLQPREFQMSLTGNAIGFGVADGDVFISRVQDLDKIIYRTAERQTNRPFREKGRRDKGLKKQVGIYLSVPRAASFAITLRLGFSKQLGISDWDLADSVITEVLDCMEAVGKGEFEALEKKIPDAAYRRNFLGLARRIAPDGEAVRTVGFTARRGRTERRVLLTRRKAEIASAELVGASEQKGKRIEVRGTLRFADSTRSGRNEIRLVDSHGKKHRVIVPEGMMDDIVRPLWDFEVEVVGVRKGTMIHLTDVSRVDEDEGDTSP